MAFFVFVSVCVIALRIQENMSLEEILNAMKPFNKAQRLFYEKLALVRIKH